VRPNPPANSMAKVVLHLLLLGIVFYVGLLLLLFVSQRRLVYFPSRLAEATAQQRAERAGWERWTDASGAFHGWRGRHPAARRSGSTPGNRLLVFHGNAGSALNRDYYREGFTQLEGGGLWEVFVFEYPGYGARPGIPGEGTFSEAARAALAALLDEDARPIFLLGESIGSGVVAGLVHETPHLIAGVVLVTPFTSLVDAAAHHYPFVPAGLILRDRFEVLKPLSTYPGPLVVRIADRDEIIPAKMGRRLHENHPGPARLMVDERATHNTLDYRLEHPFWEEASTFLLETAPGGAATDDS